MSSSHASEGFSQLKKGNAEEAARAFEQGLAADPRDTNSLLGLARVRLLEEDSDEARTLLDRLIAISPKHSEARSHLAWLDFLDGEADALDVLRSTAAAADASVFEHLNLARALALGEEHAESEASFARAIALEPKNALVHFEAGEAALEREDDERAIEHLETACALAPGELVPRLLLLRAYRYRGDFGRAQETLAALMTQAKGEPLVLEEAYALALDTGEPEAAVEHARALCKAEPDVPDHRRLLGIALTEIGQLDEARAVLTRLVEEEPELIEARHALADLLEAQGDLPGARKLLEALVAKDPTDPGPANDLALLHFGDAEGMAQAEKILRPVLEACPDDAVTNFNLALVLADRNPTEALEHAQRALESGIPAISEQAERLIAALSKTNVPKA